MKKIAYLLLILPLFLFNSCTDETPSKLDSTKWTYTVSGADALTLMSGEEEIPAGAVASFSATLNFTNGSEVAMSVVASVTVNGHSTEINNTQTGTYVYDSSTGKVIITMDGEIETGTIEKNNLTIVSDGVTMVFVKK